MAKVSSPFFGLKASGTLGNVIVFGNWKGVNYVRTWVKPANPKTAAQQAQRGFMEAAVDWWHAAEWNEADMDGWARWALYVGTAMSGFNKLIQEFLDTRVLGLIFVKMYGHIVSAVTASAFTVTVKVLGNIADLAVDLRVGTSPTSLYAGWGMTWDAVNQWYEVTGVNLLPNTIYYFRVEASKVGYAGRLGNGRVQTLVT